MLLALNIYRESSLRPVKWENPTPLVFLQGPTAANCELCHVEMLHKGTVIGPESLAFDDQGYMYTGTADGRIFRMDQNGLNPTAFFFTGGFVSSPERSGNGLSNLSEEGLGLLQYCVEEVASAAHPNSIPGAKTCGRPLGIRYQKGKLIFVDAYWGLFELTLSSNLTKWLVKPDDFIFTNSRNAAKIATLPMKFLDDLDVSRDGSVYFTDVSFEHSLSNVNVELAEAAPRGRLFRYDPRSSNVELLLCGLYFPNGLQLTHSGKSILVGESTRFRALLVDIATVQSQRNFTSCWETDMLPPGVKVWSVFPGLPDNIRANPDGTTYTIAFPAPVAAVYHTLIQLPWILENIVKFIPLQYLEVFEPKASFVGILDETGAFIQSFHDKLGEYTSKITQASFHPESGDIFIGSYINPFIGKKVWSG